MGVKELPPPAVFFFLNLHPVSWSRTADGCLNKRTTRRRGGEVEAPLFYHVRGADSRVENIHRRRPVKDSARLLLCFLLLLHSSQPVLLSNTLCCHPPPQPKPQTPLDLVTSLVHPPPLHIKQEAAVTDREKPLRCSRPRYYLSNGY